MVTILHSGAETGVLGRPPPHTEVAPDDLDHKLPNQQGEILKFYMFWPIKIDP